MKPLRNSGFGKGGLAVLPVAMMMASAPAPALTFAWFEPDAFGEVAGEVRIENVAEGGLRIETPGRSMETGVLRVDDIAIVTLKERRSRPAGTVQDSQPPELVVVAVQGGVDTRAVFRLPQPEPEPAPAAVPSPVPEPVPGGSGPDDPVDPASRTGGSNDSGTQVASIAGLPASNMPSPDATPPPEPEPVCPVLALRPGTLSDNVSRLIHECGGEMGDWVTPGSDADWRTDWMVEKPGILTDSNDGLDGLLEVLTEQYGLQGVRSDERIDIYFVR